MKISKSQQEQTRRQIIRAAVDLMTEHGYDDSTMKQIARAAGIGDATIYKYFPTKEKLMLGYYELCIAIVLEQTLETPGFDEFGLQERLQRLVDGLVGLGQGDGWGSTNANAAALLALTEIVKPPFAGAGVHVIDVHLGPSPNSLKLERRLSPDAYAIKKV